MTVNSIKLLLLPALLLLVSACSSPEPIISLSGSTMGTTYHIKVVNSDRLPEAQLLQAEIDMALEVVNDQMSTYRSDSELSKFNQLQVQQSVKVSADTIKVIEEGMRLYQETDGALDITLGPVVNLWGFGPDKRPTTIPTQAQIDNAKAKMGIKELSIKGLTLTKHIRQISCIWILS